jgi:hypothetical protein
MTFEEFVKMYQLLQSQYQSQHSILGRLFLKDSPKSAGTEDVNMTTLLNDSVSAGALRRENSFNRRNSATSPYKGYYSSISTHSGSHSHSTSSLSTSVPASSSSSSPSNTTGSGVLLEEPELSEKKTPKTPPKHPSDHSGLSDMDWNAFR